MTNEYNKRIVRRYFAEVVDNGKLDVLKDLFTSDCVIHRLEWREPVIGVEKFQAALRGFRDCYSELMTTIHDLIAEQERVASRASHTATYRGEWTSRLGRHAVASKGVSWTAMAIFHFRDGKIAEQWVNRDELGMLLELGILSRDHSAAE